MVMWVAGLAPGLVGWRAVAAAEVGLVDLCRFSSRLGLVAIVLSSEFGLWLCVILFYSIGFLCLSVIYTLFFFVTNYKRDDGWNMNEFSLVLYVSDYKATWKILASAVFKC
ncbi:hypothetical protein QQ045_015972 [Rhodiola kirilowii]